MAELMGSLRRTHYCTEVSKNDIEKEVVVAGFCDRQRDKGNLIFIDLRDRTGIIQLTFDDTTDKTVFEKAKSVRSEYVLMAKGIVKKRESINKEIKTGEIEVFVTELKILATAQTPPFHINSDQKVGDDVALKYRYLDLRRQNLQKNIMLRHNLAKITRDYFYENGFLEIETPMMIKSTPEGARDYLVPSRVQNGKFYALPQSPQMYKQLLMISGFDRYIQLARCFRDEDLRADRQPEFTQIDVEMSFVDVEDIMDMCEGYIHRVFNELVDYKLPDKLPRMTYTEAMRRFGSDKPDTRFGMEIVDISDAVKDSDFTVFSDNVKNGGTVCCIIAKNAASVLTRKEIDKLTEQAKGIGAKGLAYIRYADETPACSFKKFFTDEKFDKLLNTLNIEKGDVCLIVSDKDKVTRPVLGQLRLTVGKKLDIIPEGYNFVWITEFPFFEYDEDTKSYVAMHHPFTMPLDECLPFLETEPDKVKAKCYDLVLNGTELLSGSMRITDFELQEKMFRALGMEKEEIDAKFGFLVDAYKFGAPPHGGFGLGLDRLSMILCNGETLRDVIAFPKMQNANELMSDCPATVDDAQLQELGISINKK